MGSEQLAFLVSRTLGRMLRAATYSKVRMAPQDGALQVRKQRAFYAPLLVRLSDPLVQVLDTGVRVLPQREWIERERQIYCKLYGSSLQVDGDGALVLPRLPGTTLATLLEDPQLDDAERARAIELAVVALARFHDAGFTHGDAMAENVMVDFEAGIARWFDFETMHDASRPLAWRRADDVRALLATCMLRTSREQYAATLDLVVHAYRHEEVTRLLPVSFTPVSRRPLAFHLGQAALSFQVYREIAVLLRERLGE